MTAFSSRDSYSSCPELSFFLGSSPRITDASQGLLQPPQGLLQPPQGLLHPPMVYCKQNVLCTILYCIKNEEEKNIYMKNYGLHAVNSPISANRLSLSIFSIIICANNIDMIKMKICLCKLQTYII